MQSHSEEKAEEKEASSLLVQLTVDLITFDGFKMCCLTKKWFTVLKLWLQL